MIDELFQYFKGQYVHVYQSNNYAIMQLCNCAITGSCTQSGRRWPTTVALVPLGTSLDFSTPRIPRWKHQLKIWKQICTSIQISKYKYWFHWGPVWTFQLQEHQGRNACQKYNIQHTDFNLGVGVPLYVHKYKHKGR